jgi:hypothetical protein
MAQYPIQFPCPVRRLHVIWRKGRWSVDDEVDIPSMTLNKSHELPAAAPGHGVSGFWYEAVDAQGRVIYRQMLPDPFSVGMEIFSDEGVVRMPHQMPEEVALDVLIPDLPQITELHLYSSARPHREHEREKGAERVGALDLRTRKGGGYGRK